MSQLPSRVLMAVADVGTPNAALMQSITEIQAYSQLMATTGTPTSPQAASVIATARTNASQWYDSIYPAYLDMPSTIAGQGDSIDGGLTTLTLVAAQYATTPTDPLRAAIDEQAGGLATTVTNIEGQTSGLTTALSTFASNLQGDCAAMQGAVTAMTNEVATLYSILAALQGRLHQLQQATCPSAGDIEACSGQIAGFQQTLQALVGDLPIVTTAGQAATSAMTGLSYLNGFWGAVTEDAQACLAALAKMQTDPGVAVATDLAQTQQLWAALKQQFGGLTTQIAAI